MEKDNKEIKVIVAMSGGVDSSIAAALLKKQGFEVTGVFMRFWTENKGCASGSENAARAVAVKLKIPFEVLDVVEEFKKEVVDYFLAEQKSGRTPNPCVVCNKKIKFGVFLKKALKMKADCIATGHYVRVVRESKVENKKSKFEAKNQKFLYKIYAADDKNKDQSYFLYRLDQKQLSRVIFPLGGYTKEEAIRLAKKWRLPCQKEQSFDLCFIKGEPAGFIKKYLKLKLGDIKIFSNSNHVLARHEGLPLYTIGQRKNIPVGQGPWWVVKKDEKKNILYISNNEKDLYGQELVAEKVSWLAGRPPLLPIRSFIKIRYKSGPTQAKIKAMNPKVKNYKIEFKKSQRAITPGQSAVFYSAKGELLGGGVIK